MAACTMHPSKVKLWGLSSLEAGERFSLGPHRTLASWSLQSSVVKRFSVPEVSLAQTLQDARASCPAVATGPRQTHSRCTADLPERETATPIRDTAPRPDLQHTVNTPAADPRGQIREALLMAGAHTAAGRRRTAPCGTNDCEAQR